MSNKDNDNYKMYKIKNKQKLMSSMTKKLAKYKRLFLLSICVFTFLSSQAEVMAQNELINIKLSNVTVAEAVKAVEKQTIFKFVYNNTDINASNKVSLNAVDESIEEIARLIFTGYDVTMRGNNVIIRKNLDSNQNTNRIVTGTVVDASNGETLIGVNIVIKGTTQGVVTDFDGNY